MASNILGALEALWESWRQGLHPSCHEINKTSHHGTQRHKTWSMPLAPKLLHLSLLAASQRRWHSGIMHSAPAWTTVSLWYLLELEALAPWRWSQGSMCAMFGGPCPALLFSIRPVNRQCYSSLPLPCLLIPPYPAPSPPPAPFAAAARPWEYSRAAIRRTISLYIYIYIYISAYHKIGGDKTTPNCTFVYMYMMRPCEAKSPRKPSNL